MVTSLSRLFTSMHLSCLILFSNNSHITSHFTFSFFFFFNDTATTEIYTFPLHDALPICADHAVEGVGLFQGGDGEPGCAPIERRPRHWNLAVPVASRLDDGQKPGAFGQVRQDA